MFRHLDHSDNRKFKVWTMINNEEKENKVT